MQDRYIAAADLGSSKIALSVAKIEGKDVQVHYYKELPSEGISRGAIQNPRKASTVLQRLVNDANEELGIKIMQLIVALPRYRIDQEQGNYNVPRTDSDTAISAKEINDLVGVAIDSYPFDDDEKREIYGAVPQSFSVENQSIVSESDVVGVYSDFVEGHFTFFLGQKSSVKGITHALNEANLALAKKVFVPDTTAGAILTDDEKESGVGLIEIGGDVTSVTIYKGKRLKYYSSIPFGGKSITKDISNECGFSFKLAENIKIAYGSCTPNNLYTLSEKTIQINNESGSFDRLTVKYLAEIIEERCKEIIDAVLYMIQESGFSGDLRRGVVLTGGGSKLSGLKSMLSNMSGYEVRLGYPCANKFRVDGVPAATELSAAASMGMILDAQKDENLNCINELIVDSAPIEVPKQEEKKFTENERVIPNKKSNDAEAPLLDFERVIPPKGDKKKPSKPTNGGWEKLLKKLGNGIEKAGVALEKGFDNTIGTLYDESGNE